MSTALYSGSYLDLAPSVAIENVTYVNLDGRAERSFADRELVEQQLQDAGTTFRLVTDGLDRYLVPKRPEHADVRLRVPSLRSGLSSLIGDATSSNPT